MRKDSENLILFSKNDHKNEKSSLVYTLFARFCNLKLLF